MSWRFEKIRHWLRIIMSDGRVGQPQSEPDDGPFTNDQIEMIRKLAQSECDPKSIVRRQPPGRPGRIDAEKLMARLDVDRASGLLARQLQGNADVIYSASENTKGGVVAIYRDGRHVEGAFRDGVFIPHGSYLAGIEKIP